MATHLPEEYAERSQIHEQEMKEMCSQDKVILLTVLISSRYVTSCKKKKN